MASLSIAPGGWSFLPVYATGSAADPANGLSLGATLLIIDPGVPAYDALMAAATPGTEVYRLNNQTDGLVQITQILAGRQGIHSLHIVSHGSPNGLHFRGGTVGSHNIDTYAHLWPTWRQSLAPDANILLYGCQVAAPTADEISLVAHLAQHTGATVAASSRPTGHAALGGDWALEVSTGPITARPALQPSALAAYPHLLSNAFFKLSDFTLPTDDSRPFRFADVDGTLFFIADSSTTGLELWKSDGTAAGTVLMKGFSRGNALYEPQNLTNVNGTLYFTAYDPVMGLELWKSDGTEAGTRVVKDINSGGSDSGPYSLTNVNGTLYFTADDGTHGSELWKSDGTEAGTVLVKDINPGSNFTPSFLTNINGTLYFTADDGTHGKELWKSDGTEAGTVLVKDINPGSNHPSSAPRTHINNTLFLTADDGTHGSELWKSDGTEAGTVLVKDIYAGTSGSDPILLANVNGTLYFRANDGIHGIELWKSDGTEAGTVLVKDIYAGTKSFYPLSLTDVNGTLFFTANDLARGSELWKSDGTEAGTVLVKGTYAGSGLVPTYLTNVNGTLFFKASDPTHGSELWKSDGTEAGTVLVKDIVVGGGSSEPYHLTNVNGTLYFQASDPVHGSELWKSDGTEAGTVLVKDINWQDRVSPEWLTIVDGVGYFKSYDPTTGWELWKSDGTTAGTVLVKDINPGRDSSNPGNLVNVNSTLFFTASDPTTGWELWKSDGTTAGTVLVKDINPGSGSPNPGNLVNVNGTLFFTASDPTTGWELWKSDGTTAGTVLVKDINPGGNDSAPSHLTHVNGTLYFTAYDGITGWELWKSDGTTAGTVMVKDVSLNRTRFYIEHLINVNGTLYFTTRDHTIAYDGTTGWNLWRSDGTTAGTVLVKDIRLNPSGSYPQQFTNVNGTLFFTFNDGITGWELWKSDGTTAGTVMVNDIRLGIGSSEPYHLTHVNGTLYFTAYNDATGTELWKSDGTAAGTMLVSDICLGSSSSKLRNLTNINGTLYFTADDGIHGVELWKSDGTAAGTMLVGDINPGSHGSSPSGLSLLGSNTLVFFANDGVSGIELYKIRVNALPTGSVTITGTAIQGQTLLVSTDIADIDGIPGPITYQWQADGIDINGATGTTLRLTPAYVGKAIRVIARYIDGLGTPEAIASIPTSAVIAPDIPGPNPTQIIPLANQLLSVIGGNPTRLTATVTVQGAASVLDIAVVVVDDAEGRINGLLPSDGGYAAAALERANTLMAVLQAGNFAGQFGRRSLAVSPGQFLQLALIQGGTLDDLQRGGAGQLFFATGAANGNGQSIVQYSPTATGLTLTFTLPGSTAPSVTLQLGLDPAPAPVGSQPQGLTPQSELLDLTGMAGPTATLSFEVFREASFNNIVGFYTVEDTQGRVRDPLTGNLLTPGEAGYTQAALANRVVSNLAGQNGQTLTYTAEVATGQLLSTFLVVNGPLDALLDSNPGNDPTVFFNHIAANGDGQDHVRLLGDNTFGFEDIFGGGDQDFDDVVVKVSIA